MLKHFLTHYEVQLVEVFNVHLMQHLQAVHDDAPSDIHLVEHFRYSPSGIFPDIYLVEHRQRLTFYSFYRGLASVASSEDNLVEPSDVNLVESLQMFSWWTISKVTPDEASSIINLVQHLQISTWWSIFRE